MSLIDLKKNDDDPRKKKRNFTVDEFIADAENYARGHRDILLDQDLSQPLELTEALAISHQVNEQQKQHKPYRHATFTLSEHAIAQLTELAKQSNLAKSHILRILINELCQEDQKTQLQTLLNSQVK